MHRPSCTIENDVMRVRIITFSGLASSGQRKGRGDQAIYLTKAKELERVRERSDLMRSGPASSYHSPNKLSSRPKRKAKVRNEDVTRNQTHSRIPVLPRLC